MQIFNHLRIGHRLLGVALVGALCTLGVGLLGLASTSQVKGLLDDTYDNNLVPVADIANANMQAIYHNRALYAYVVETDKSEMDSIAAQMKRFEASKAELLDKYAKTAAGSRKADALQRYQASWPAYMATSEQVMRLSQEGKITEAMALVNGEARTSFQQADDILSEMLDMNTALALQSHEQSERVVAQAQGVAMGVILLCIALSVALALWVARGVTRSLNQAIQLAGAVQAGDLTQQVQVRTQDEAGQLLGALGRMQASLVQVVGQVRSNADGVAVASAQIAQGNADLSQRTEEQASAVEQTAATMHQLSATVKNNADNAHQADQLAQQASAVAERGGAVVGEVVQTMKGINDSSKKIAEIIGTIDGIAFQTNILALNAAVEAARAGEQGRGFAVVASEVRSLAQRSGEAAREIKALIGTSVERVAQGTALVDQAGATMAEVVAAIRRVNDIVGEISSASSEQASGVSQVGEAIAQMDRMTQQNAALVEESAAAALSLQGQGQALVSSVSVFQLQGAAA